MVKDHLTLISRRDRYLIDQASSRGHLQQTANGLLSFHLHSTINLPHHYPRWKEQHIAKRIFCQWQRDFYQNSVPTLLTIPLRLMYSVTCTPSSNNRYLFTDAAQTPGSCYTLKKDIQAEGYNFRKT